MGKDPYPEGKKVVVVGAVTWPWTVSDLPSGLASLMCTLSTEGRKPRCPQILWRSMKRKKKALTSIISCNPKRIIEKDGKVVGVECNPYGTRRTGRQRPEKTRTGT